MTNLFREVRHNQSHKFRIATAAFFLVVTDNPLDDILPVGMRDSL
jgi:hypothetical protein